jgi:lipopolysaccharide transport system permease protein
MVMLNKIGDKSRELIRYREMFTGLVDREVRARYRGSALGFVWSLLNPLLLMAIYSLVFSVFMRVNVPHYALFLFTGLLPWAWFSTALSNATAAVVANGNLIKKVYFPLEILPLVNVTTNLVNYLLSLPVLAIFMAASGLPFTRYLVFFPLLVAIQFLLTLGLSLILCTLNAFFRDVEQLLQPMLMAWFYLTPIVYTQESVPAGYRFLIYLNPMAPLIKSYQDIFFSGHAPEFGTLGYAAALGVGAFMFGYLIFHRHKFSFAEVV